MWSTYPEASKVCRVVFPTRGEEGKNAGFVCITSLELILAFLLIRGKGKKCSLPTLNSPYPRQRGYNELHLFSILVIALILLFHLMYGLTAILHHQFDQHVILRNFSLPTFYLSLSCFFSSLLNSILLYTSSNHTYTNVTQLSLI